MANSDKSEPLQVLSSPEKLIAKLATKIAVARTGDSYILTFVSEIGDEQAQMIERVVIPSKTVDELIEIVKGLKEAK
jgi:hypothetical protein